MKISYSCILEISTEANSQRDAEKMLRNQLSKLRSLAEAFDFTYETSVGTKTSDNPLYRYIYVFSVKLEFISECGSTLQKANVITFFAHLNSFEICKEESYFFEDESEAN